MRDQITPAEFYKGRDAQYPLDLTEEIKAFGRETLRRANSLLDVFYSANPQAHRRSCNSGWRPPIINASVPNAAPKSKHMLAQAIDIEDDDGCLDAWCMSPEGRSAMIQIGLWLESPSSTPRWCHLQIVAPASGNRIFQVA